MQYSNGYIFDAPYARMYSPGMSKTDNTDDVGSRLDEAMRPKFGTNQSALSRASEVPQPTIARILNGKVGKRGPEAMTVKKLAAACEVRFDWLNQGIAPKSLGEKTGADLRPVPASPTKGAKEYPVDGAELMEWIELYRTSDPSERKRLLRAAQIAREVRAKRGGKRTKSTPNQS